VAVLTDVSGQPVGHIWRAQVLNVMGTKRLAFKRAAPVAKPFISVLKKFTVTEAMNALSLQ
jgi:hypothetical protein